MGCPHNQALGKFLLRNAPTGWSIIPRPGHTGYVGFYDALFAAWLIPLAPAVLEFEWEACAEPARERSGFPKWVERTVHRVIVSLLAALAYRCGRGP